MVGLPAACGPTPACAGAQRTRRRCATSAWLRRCRPPSATATSSCPASTRPRRSRLRRRASARCAHRSPQLLRPRLIFDWMPCCLGTSRCCKEQSCGFQGSRTSASNLSEVAGSMLVSCATQRPCNARAVVAACAGCGLYYCGPQASSAEYKQGCWGGVRWVGYGVSGVQGPDRSAMP